MFHIPLSPIKEAHPKCFNLSSWHEPMLFVCQHFWPHRVKRWFAFPLPDLLRWVEPRRRWTCSKHLWMAASKLTIRNSLLSSCWGCRMPLKYLPLIKPTVMTLLHYALSGSKYLKRDKLILSGTCVPSWRVFVQQTYFGSSFLFLLVRLIADPKEDLQGREILIAIVSSDAEFFFTTH